MRDLDDRGAALAQHVAEAVRARVAAAQDRDAQALRAQLGRRHGQAGDAPVLLHEVLHGEVHAGQLGARQRERPVALGAGGEHERVVAGAQLLERDVAADGDAEGELDALGDELLDAAIDQVLLELEVGDAVAQQAAGAVVALVHGHRVAGARELLRRGEAGRARADDADGMARARRGRLRRDPALLPGALDDRPLDLLDRDGVVVDREDAGLLAGRRAELAGQLGEAVGGVQALARLLPVAAVHEVVPVGDEVAERAARWQNGTPHDMQRRACSRTSPSGACRCTSR